MRYLLRFNLFLMTELLNENQPELLLFPCGITLRSNKKDIPQFIQKWWFMKNKSSIVMGDGRTKKFMWSGAMLY